ncbi:MAG: hypothetical protein SFU86_24600 [Pirellulaceae bacterium]|nr:hypothetical protein [Pirellulaceae bacterium]
MPSPDIPAAPPSDAALADYFAYLRGNFAAVADRLGGTARDFSIAGRPVRVHLAGSELLHLARPLSHLASIRDDSPSGELPLEIFAWESTASGLLPEPPSWDLRNLLPRGEIAGLSSAEFAVNFTSDHCLLAMFQRSTRRAIYWLPRAADLPYWETAAPFRTIFHWWGTTFGGQLVHAAAVGKCGRGVLLVGRGGSGKSTTALLAVEAGLDYVGDDYVLLTSDPQPTAHSLYHSAKMHTAFLRATVPHWQSRVAAEIGPERKSLFFLHESRPDQVIRQLSLQAILHPRVTTHSAASLQPARASAALLAAAPSTMYQLPDARQATLSFLADLTRRLPAHSLLLGKDLLSGPRQIAALLDAERTYRAA